MPTVGGEKNGPKRDVLDKNATSRKKRRLGRPSGAIEILRRNRVVTMVTDSELEQLTVLAESENESLSATVHRILSRHLKRQKNK